MHPGGGILRVLKGPNIMELRVTRTGCCFGHSLKFTRRRDDPGQMCWHPEGAKPASAGPAGTGGGARKEVYTVNCPYSTDCAPNDPRIECETGRVSPSLLTPLVVKHALEGGGLSLAFVTAPWCTHHKKMCCAGTWHTLGQRAGPSA